MSAKSKRQEDAESIVGRDNAEALEVEDQKLVGRTSTSDIDPLAVVERKHKGDDDEYEADDAVDEDEDEDKKKKRKALKKRAEHASNTHEEDDDEEEENGEDGKKKKKKKGPPFGGAKSLADAETFMVDRAGGDPILLDSLNVLAGVLTNIAGVEHGEAIATQLAEYQTRLDAQVLRTLSSVEQSLNGTEVTMPEETKVLDPQAEVTEAEAAPNAAEVEAQPEANEGDSGKHVLEPVFASLRAAYDEARETPADQAVRLKMIQEPLNDFAAALKANIGGTDVPEAGAVGGGGITIEMIQQAVAAGVAPLAAEFEAFKSASAVAGAPVAPVDPAEPVRRALQTAAFAQVGNGPPKEVIMESDTRNPKTDKNVTPGLRSLVRRTVGLGG